MSFKRISQYVYTSTLMTELHYNEDPEAREPTNSAADTLAIIRPSAGCKPNTNTVQTRRA
jgi:hypothetical protein